MIWIISTTGLHARPSSMTIASNTLQPESLTAAWLPPVTYIFYCLKSQKFSPRTCSWSPALSCCTQHSSSQIKWFYHLRSENSVRTITRGSALIFLDDDTVCDVRIPRMSQASLPFIHEALPGTLMRIVHCLVHTGSTQEGKQTTPHFPV